MPYSPDIPSLLRAAKAVKSVAKVTSVCPAPPKFRPFTAAAPAPFRFLDIRRTASELPTQVVLTTGGDMMVQLLHKEITTECTVSSHILKQASAIFNAMLSKDRFQEGTDLSQSTEKSGLYTLKLHDDDAPAMLEILKALYHRGHQVSKRISFQDLVAIAELSEKYDLYEALYPWAQLWTPRVAHLAYDPGCEHWLLIAWAFREEKVFRELSRTVILELAAGSSLLLHPSLPDSVVDKIYAVRESAIGSILAICKAYVARYSALDTGCNREIGGYNQACNTLMYGALMKCLSYVSLSPGHYSMAKTLSVKQIVQKLHSLGDKIFDFVRDSLLPCTLPATRGTFPASSDPRCEIHGKMKRCPGKTFHVECSFLPSMLEEVNIVVEKVQGLGIDEFESRML